MKVFSVFVVAFIALASISEAYIHYNGARTMKSLNKKAIDFLYFDQRNNHFSPADVSTFKQRYLVNSSVWGGNGYPIIVLLGGESSLSSLECSGIFIINEKAEKLKALMVAVEHRFYGKSIPGDGTLSDENFKLLNSQQALADYAVFIQFIKEKYKAKDSKVVTIGGSYPGVLSARIRQKYPNVVDIAYSSSAPVLNQLSFSECAKVITDDLGTKCVDNVAKLIKKIEQLLESDPSKVEESLGTCSKFETDLDKALFFSMINDAFGNMVLRAGGSDDVIVQTCNDLDSKGNTLEALGEMVQGYQPGCITNNYTDYMNQLKNPETESSGNSIAFYRSWLFQVCTELGYFQNTDVDGTPFSKRVTMDFLLGECRDVFGIDVNNPQKTLSYVKNYFGGRDMRSDKIVFTLGSLDPWYALGMNSNSDDMPLILIQNISHCADVRAATVNDSKVLVEGREKAWNYVEKWLNGEQSSSDGYSLHINILVFSLFVLLMLFITY